MAGDANGPSRLRLAMLAAYGLAAVALGVLLGWLTIRDLQWREMRDLLSSANLLLVFFAFAVVLAAGYLRGVRWRLLLQPDDVSAMRLFLIEQTGTALDTLSLVHILDEVVEVGILTVRDKLLFGRVLATIAMQRTLEFATTVLLLAGGALFLGPMREFWPYLAGGFIGSAAALLLLFTAGPAISRFWWFSRLRLAHEFAGAMLELREHWSRSLLAFMISVTQASMIGISGWLLSAAIGLDLSLPVMVVVTLGVVFFGSVVPGLPMAFGTYEFAALLLLGLWGRSSADAVSFALALRAVVYVPPLLFAVIFLPREGLFSIGSMQTLLSEARATRRAQHA